MIQKENARRLAQMVPQVSTLSNGRHVLVDLMTEAQIHEAFILITEAAEEGQGFGADEYVDEAEFRSEIDDGYQFAVTDKSTGEMVAAFILAISKYSRGCPVADPFILVKKGQRGSGLGYFCMDLVVKFAKDLGFLGIYCDTFSNNAAMIRIIESVPGFRQVGCLPMGGVLQGGGLVGTVIYYKDLRPAHSTERG